MFTYLLKWVFFTVRLNNEVKDVQFLVNYSKYNLVHKVNTRILRENLKVRRICDSQSPRGKRLAPAVKNSLQEAMFRTALAINPRPAGVWLVTRPARGGGGGANPP